jgi:hypothetical protein
MANKPTVHYKGKKMRKYRGKTKDGKWVYGYVFESIPGRPYIIQPHSKIVSLLQLDYGLTISPSLEQICEVIPSTVGQQTGLTDKHGVDVYEGTRFRGMDSGTVYTVVFREGEYILTYECTSPPDKDRHHCGLRYALHNLALERISNIHDTPEKEQGDGKV